MGDEGPRWEIRASGVCGACQRRVRRLSASAGTLGVMTELAIEAAGLAKPFGETKALDGVDLAVRQGTVLGVLGPNGAGKTTAVRILATLLRADAGTARVGGFDVARSPARSARPSASTGQYASVDEDLTGTQNLVLIGQLLDLPRRDAHGARRRAARLVRPDRGRRAGRPRPTPAACAGGSTSPPASSAGPR